MLFHRINSHDYCNYSINILSFTTDSTKKASARCHHMKRCALLNYHILGRQFFLSFLRNLDNNNVSSLIKVSKVCFAHNIIHWNFNLCNRRGLPGPFDHGIQRMTMSAHRLSNGMGDDGFIRRNYMQVRRPCYYADTLGTLVK